MSGPTLPPKRLLINAAYALIVLFVSFAIAQVVGTVFGWVLRPETAVQADMRYNYNVAYPIRGIAALAAYFLSLWCSGRTHAYRVAFSLRETMTRFDFLVETLPALLLLQVLLYRFCWSALPSWYLAGGLASLFGLICPGDMYSMDFGGTSVEGLMDIDAISLQYYLWLQILVDVVIAVGAVLLLWKARRSGERAAAAAHERQLAEMRRDSGLE